MCLNLPEAVPVFNIDKRPFALICAYNACDPSRRFVSTAATLGFLAYSFGSSRGMSCPTYVLLVGVLAIPTDDVFTIYAGVIILSAVLKRRMVLADQAKGLFISKWAHSR